MPANAYAHLPKEKAKRICARFGFPGYFRVELAIANLRNHDLIASNDKKQVERMAYTGFVTTLI